VARVDSRKLPLLIAAATLLPMLALAWIGVRTLEQDRELERQRQEERLDVAAGRLALEIERDLQAVEADLRAGRGIRFTPDGFAFGDEQRPLYQPAGPSAIPPPLALTAGGSYEFELADPARAASNYARLAQSDEPTIRGQALVAAARVLRRQKRFVEALRTYDELETLGATLVAAGEPAALVARQGRGKVLEAIGDVERRTREAIALAADLSAARWRIDRPTFEFYRGLVEQWNGPASRADAIQRTEAVLDLWRLWQLGELPAQGRRLVRSGTSASLAAWVSGADGPVARVLTAAEWHGKWADLTVARRLSIAIVDTDGRILAGEEHATAAVLSPAETRLPFLLAIASADPSGDAGESRRRGLLVGGLALALVLMAAGSYGLYRVTTGELLLARQQSDFVAAVSHEFRTPLTSMRHLTDLLARRAVADDERRGRYYELLARETERLHRMVESLLSFGRLEAAAHVWQFAPVALDEVLGELALDFRRDHQRELHVQLESNLPAVRADREAVARAVWNLLDNAAKYSEPAAPVCLSARSHQRFVHLVVEDRGPGISVAERKRIFHKFVRGDQAKRAGIRGVGIGLALVKQVADAHGGTVQLDSVPGRGSTFTLVLPCHES
jgi:signal transduction histidine kinase